MSSNPKRKPLAIAIGAAFTASLAAAPVAQAEAANPFGFTDLGSGYSVPAFTMLEGNCGGDKDKDKDKDKGEEGKCGEGKCGEDKDKDKDEEGKCGEGKCGEDKDKGEEGKCGEGKCGAA